MNIPDTATCIRLMDEYRMLENIRHHSLVVARVADLIFTELDTDPLHSPVQNRSLVLAGALLHDIAKTPCLDNSCDHATAGAEICRKHGYLEVASIVEQHVVLQEFDPKRYTCGRFNAADIVYYADKRVCHSQIVNLSQRLEYILEHYGNNDSERHGLIRENFQRCLNLEQVLFTFLPFTADALEQYVCFPQPPAQMWDDPWS